ncbi:saccharopine dehydrogenase family protein [Halobellus salinus]|uniref:saccharopine dehydrogenase family protein n=1 Tax=Halobellus salinus TaxID=931585 RepID=UPI00166890D5|nr:saccharopine dehydrogenase NADP-binding domain-containing protein [Halobellus salinus]SMP34239.1 Uncharacterized conserved protein [Halobellus salinus]
MTGTKRPYDIVVWGATGVAGGLLADYLVDQYTSSQLSVALGGRDPDRLEGVAATFTDRYDGWDELPTVVGDATQIDTLREVVEQTSVVCTTVGPYTTYGTPLVEACIDAGTDYCDLTGEVNWVRETVDRYHDAAVAADTRIVHSCGFDSVPADLGTILAQSYATETYGSPCDVVQIYLADGDGSVSGGTLASFGELFEAASTDPIAKQTLENPYSLAPPGERDGVDPGEQTSPQRDRLGPGWTAPSPMAPVNERIVRRSNALLNYPWGREFRCTEVVPTGSGVRGAAEAALIATSLSGFKTAMGIDTLRDGIREYVFPDPGEGPTRAAAMDGSFTVRILGRGTGTDGQFTVEATVGADIDPGYGATARMLGESGMALLRGDTDSPLDGGVLTPASAIGAPLADRLRAIGFLISVGDASAGASA